MCVKLFFKVSNLSDMYKVFIAVSIRVVGSLMCSVHNAVVHESGKIQIALE